MQLNLFLFSVLKTQRRNHVMCVEILFYNPIPTHAGNSLWCVPAALLCVCVCLVCLKFLACSAFSLCVINLTHSICFEMNRTVLAAPLGAGQGHAELPAAVTKINIMPAYCPSTRILMHRVQCYMLWIHRHIC